MARTRGNFPDRLTVDDAGEAEYLLLTIESARIQSFSKDYLSDGDRKVVLTFKETGDKEYVVNATSFHLLVDRYGNDKAGGFKAWDGKQVVLKRAQTTNPTTGENVAALHVARPKEWDTAVRALSKPQGRRRS